MSTDQLQDFSGLTEEEKTLLSKVGYQSDDHRSGTCVLVDQDVRYSVSNNEQVEVMPLRQALDRYDWVQDLMFGLIDPDENEHVKRVAERAHDPIGHFIRVREGAKIKLPLQTFSAIEIPQGRQFIHNVTVIEKDAEVEMISGSAVPDSIHAGHHISIGECYLREGSRLRTVSIEQWGAEMEVHSYTRTQIGKAAHSTTNQVLMTRLRHHFSQGKTFVEENGRSNDQAVIFAPPGTNRVMESECHLKGAGANSESLTRVVAAGGNVTNRTMLIGEANGTKGFVGCDGLKLSAEGEVLSVPGLLAKTSSAQLSHEASVGMISEEKLAYLMASGMTEDAARDLIIQGFLNLKEQHLPEPIRKSVENMIAAAKSGSM